MPVYRYRQDFPNTISVAKLSKLIPDIPTSISTVQPSPHVDIDVAASSKADLDDVMANAGYTFVEQDPTLARDIVSRDEYGAVSIGVWSNEAMTPSTTTVYVSPGYDSELMRVNPRPLIVGRSGLIRGLKVRQLSPAGNGNNIVYTLRKNSVATALSVTIASTASVAQDVVNEVMFEAGDALDIEVTKAASVVSAPEAIFVTAELA